MSIVAWCDHGVGEIAVYDIATEDAYCVVDGEGNWAWPEDDNITKQRERAANIVKCVNCHDDLLEALMMVAEVDIAGADDRSVRLILAGLKSRAKAAVERAEAQS